MIFILIYNRKKEGIKTLLIIPPTHLSHHREGLHSQSYKDMKDLNIIRCFESGVKG
jgi:putative aminopeptidase FrvX